MALRNTWGDRIATNSAGHWKTTDSHGEHSIMALFHAFLCQETHLRFGWWTKITSVAKQVSPQNILLPKWNTISVFAWKFLMIRWTTETRLELIVCDWNLLQITVCFTCHRSGHYTLSEALSLSQTDGSSRAQEVIPI